MSPTPCMQAAPPFGRTGMPMARARRRVPMRWTRPPCHDPAVARSRLRDPVGGRRPRRNYRAEGRHISFTPQLLTPCHETAVTRERRRSRRLHVPKICFLSRSAAGQNDDFSGDGRFCGRYIRARPRRSHARRADPRTVNGFSHLHGGRRASLRGNQGLLLQMRGKRRRLRHTAL